VLSEIDIEDGAGHGYGLGGGAAPERRRSLDSSVHENATGVQNLFGWSGFSSGLSTTQVRKQVPLPPPHHALQAFDQSDPLRLFAEHGRVSVWPPSALAGAPNDGRSP